MNKSLESNRAQIWYDDPEYTAVCHKADMDGLGCALLLDQFTEVSDITFQNYPLPEDFGVEGKVVVCDLNLSPDSAAWYNKNLVLFDHHGEAPEDATPRFAFAEDDGSHCATRLLWGYMPAMRLGEEEMERWIKFINTVNAGDLYLTQDVDHYEQSRRYTWLLRKIGIEAMLDIARADVETFTDPPAALLQLVDAARKREDAAALNAAQKFAVTVRDEDLGDYVVTLLIGGDTSTILNGMSEELQVPVVGLCPNLIDDDWQMTASIRDPQGRAREIAESFGGGGHKEAAGFTIDLLENDILSFQIKSQ